MRGFSAEMQDSAWLAQAVRSRESALLEHKQQWYDLNTNSGKAEFVKDILAMANTVTPELDGHIIIGVADKRGGGGIVGVESPPGEERLQQILASYTTPVPAIEHTLVEIDGKNLSVIKVRWMEYHPHYATREVPGTLSSTQAYVRSGATNRTLSLRELEGMIRQKDARLGTFETRRPIVAGFVEEPALVGGSKLVARVVNRSTEPVAGVSTIWDLSLTRNPACKVRRQGLVNAPFLPGEAREVEIDFRNISFRENEKQIDQGSSAWRSGMDVVLYVKYRDEEGLIQEFSTDMTIAGL